MAQNQGWRGHPTLLFGYIEGATTSSAWGIDDTDSGKFKVQVLTGSNAVPTGTVQFIIDPSANGNITVTPNGSGKFGVTTLGNGVILSNASGLFSSASPSTAGFVLTSNGASSTPTFQALPAGGVTSITGTANQITASASTGAVTLSTPSTFIAPGTIASTTTNAAGTNFLLPTTSSTAGQLQINATRFLHSYGTNNTFVGSGVANFTLTGNQNCALGVSTLAAASSATNNVAVGYLAQQHLTSGQNNTAIGSEAQVNGIVTGSDNIAIGYQCQPALTSGNQNIGMGSNTQNLLTSASSNVGIGHNAQSNMTSGTHNVGIGNTTQGSATLTGAGNVGVGDNVQQNMTSGANNVSVGYLSFQYATQGGNNVSLGYNSLNALTTGSYNVVAGSGSGASLATSDSHNVLINHAGTGGTSNVLRIGASTGTGTQQLNSAFICGINGITVTGTAVLVSASDQLGIAVSSRRYKDNIIDMGSQSNAIMAMRPVSFNYKEDAAQVKSFGLIAEEVYDLIPELVVLDKEGLPQTVKYHELPALLLNEIQKLNKRIEQLEARINA